jgi:hypothetical protein
MKWLKREATGYLSVSGKIINITVLYNYEGKKWREKIRGVLSTLYIGSTLGAIKKSLLSQRHQFWEATSFNPP